MQQHFTCRDKAYFEAFKGVSHTPHSAPVFAKTMLFSPAVCWSAYSQTMVIGEPGHHRTNCITTASLGSTGFKQIANKLKIYLTTALSSLALTCNTHEALVTKTWDWQKCANNMQSFQITIHGLQRKTVIMKVGSLQQFVLLFCLEKVCILLYSHVFFCIHL